MNSEEQDQQFLELVHLLFKKSRGTYNQWNRQLFDKFLSNLYSQYYHLFHPSKYLTLRRLKKIFGSTKEINSEELKTNEVELAHQAKEILHLKRKHSASYILP